MAAIGLLLLGGLLRVAASATVGLNRVDSLKLALARSLTLDPQHPSRLFLYWGEGLAPVGLQLLKGLDGGGHLLWLRLPWILAGTATLALLYGLVRQTLGRPQALLATFLLAVDQFHVTWTRMFSAEILAMGLEVAVLWALWQGLTAPHRQFRWFLLVGILLATAYHVKMASLLLLLGLGVYLLALRRPLGLRRIPPRALAVAVTAFSALILPTVLWIARHPMDNPAVYRRLTILEPGPHFPLTPVALYLAGVARGWRRRREPFVALLLTVFSTISLFYAAFSAPGMNHYWWPYFGLIPAIVLAADLLAALWQRARGTRIVVLGLCGYLAIHLVAPLAARGQDYPAYSPQTWTVLQVESGLEAMAQERFSHAYAHFLWASKLDPANAPLHAWLVEAYTQACHQKKLGRSSGDPTDDLLP